MLEQQFRLASGSGQAGIYQSTWLTQRQDAGLHERLLCDVEPHLSSFQAQFCLGIMPLFLSSKDQQVCVLSQSEN